MDDTQIETIPHRVISKPVESSIPDTPRQRRRSTKEDRQATETPGEYKQPIALESFMKNLTIEEGNRAKFICSVIGQVKGVEWYKDNVPLDAKGDRRYSTTNSDGLVGLEIQDVVVSDSGYYTCTILGQRNNVTTSSKLTVYERYEPRKKSISYDRPPIQTSLPEYIAKGIISVRFIFSSHSFSHFSPTL